MSFKIKDHYYKKAKKEKFLARSIYKLEEIDGKYSVLRKKDIVLDLGYYPGSWVQYAAKKVGEEGRVVGVDIQEVNSKLTGIKNVRLYSKDFFSIENLEDIGVNHKFDVVISDMAPNTTGIKSVDQARSIELVERVFNILPIFLKEGGHVVIKVFDSQDAQNFLKKQKQLFKKFYFLKPSSTRSTSKEFFVIGKERKRNE